MQFRWSARAALPRTMFAATCAAAITLGALGQPGVVRAAPITITVTSAADTGGSCPGASCTLREAIALANANPGTDTIAFAIGAAGSAATIQPTSALPAIIEAVVIDGWSQGGMPYVGVPLIEIQGVGAGSADGLVLDVGSNGSTIRGLVINQFAQNGIVIRSDSNRVAGSYIGTTADGSAAAANAGAGVIINNATATGNIIGTDGDGVNDAAEGNVISGNGMYGINLNQGDGNAIAGNIIGLNAAGNSAVPNVGAGVVIFTSGNLIGTNDNGTSDADEANVISGNITNNFGTPSTSVCMGVPGDGIALVNSASGNRIAGNIIGLNAAGTAPIGNTCDGINIGSPNNHIGVSYNMGSSTAGRNVVAGNRMSNINIFYTSGTEIAGNYIGTTADGLGAASSSGFTYGIQMQGGTSTTIGTNSDAIGDEGERNIIAGNPYTGIRAISSDSTHIAGNFIGVSAAGQPLGNGYAGITIDNNSHDFTIGVDGDNDDGERFEGNVISSNVGNGIEIYSGLASGADNNVIAGNSIGTDPSAAGGSSFGNMMSGISLNSMIDFSGTRIPANNNRIGTNDDGVNDDLEPNVIGNNGGSGISLFATGPATIAGNFIGTNTKANLLPNGGNGIQVFEGDPITIGGGSSAAGNLIAGNIGSGIGLVGSSPTIKSNTITQNGQSGITVDVSFNGTFSPAQASDDVVARPQIGGAGGGNTIRDNCASAATSCAGIFALDTAPANSATLESDNTPYANSGANYAEQHWYGAAELISGGSPVAGMVTLDSANGGPSYTLGNSASCAALGTTIHSGNVGVNCDNVMTWANITEYVVSAAGTRSAYMPVTAAAPTTGVYSFDGDAATDPADTGAGFVGEGIATGALSRYQIMEINLAAATPTPTNTPTWTPTNTPTWTPTNTPSLTPSSTPTRTPSPTASNTPTRTPSATPSDTPTATVTATPSDTPTVTPSATPSATPSDTPTATVTATPSDTPSATTIPSVTPTGTLPARPTETSTPTPTVTPTPGAGVTHQLFIPLLMRDGMPDLTVTNVVIAPAKQAFTTGDQVTISVTVKNQGSAATASGFWVDLYVQPSAAPTINTLWHEVCGITPCVGMAWPVRQALAPGQSITLTTTASYDPQRSFWLGWLPNGTSDIYAMADSWNTSGTVGAVAESDEQNNLFHLGGLSVSGANPPYQPWQPGATRSESVPARIPLDLTTVEEAH